MACHKAKYVDKAMATLEMRRVRASGKQVGHVYECRCCGYWHHTHYSKAEWRRVCRVIRRAIREADAA